MIRMNNQTNKAYPTPRVERQSLYYASLLLEDYAGVLSEETDVHTYLYQYLVLKSKYPEIADAFLQIAQMEMYHLQLLGKVISLLGIDPKFRTIDLTTKRESYWTSQNVSYEQGLFAILNHNIQREQQAIERYQLHRNLIQDIYIKNLLTRIIEDERSHIQIFQTMLNQFLRK